MPSKLRIGSIFLLFMIIGPVKRTIFALFNHKQELGLLINMELHTLDDLYEDFEIGRWKVRKFVLPNASDYLWDIENITWAQTGFFRCADGFPVWKGVKLQGTQTAYGTGRCYNKPCEQKPTPGL